MVVKWQFHDPSLGEVYQFEVNPNEDGLPAREKNFSYETTTSPDGRVLIFQGKSPALKGEFSGVTLSQEQHEMFIHWFEKENQIEVTDDLGRTFSIIIESYKPTRRWKVSHNWRHDYTMSYVIVDW